MNRNGNSILAGTLLISLLFSPTMRSSAPGQTQQFEQERSGPVHSRSSKIPATSSELSPDDGERIDRDAEAVYLRDFRALINSECEKGDRSEVKINGDRHSQVKIPAALKNGKATKEPGAARIGCQLKLGNFLIALLPDPVHTHLALQFDRGVDAIEQALQDEGYLFVESKMPWDAKTHPESEDHVEREATELADEARQKQPGVMIFRAQNAADPTDLDPLIVLVVSEAPTTGINKDQFHNAVWEMETLIGADPNRKANLTLQQRKKLWPVSPGLRILGPTFSGSLQSLHDLLECKDQSHSADSPQCYPMVSIHSGTASSYGAIKDFDISAAGLGVHFVSFQESDEVMIERFKQFVTGSGYGNRNYKEGKIALLSEDESAYGNWVKNQDDSQKGGARQPPPLRAEKDGEAYGNIADWWPEPISRHLQWLKPTVQDKERPAYGKQDEPGSLLTLYFPREISQLRAAYQKDVASAATTDGRNAPRDILPDYADVPGSDDDTVASYSARQMPMSQEAVMLGIVSELRRHKTQFILVRATDPMDTLFLIRYLRTAYAQGRIVTLDADLLFRREAEDPRFHGLLSLATYGLATAANHGFRDYEEHAAERVFPSTFEAGTYNAARSLLIAWAQGSPSCAALPASPVPSDLHWEIGSGTCGQKLFSHVSHPLQLYQYGWRQQPEDGTLSDYDAPPVRLLALGRDQYWPVAALGPYEFEPTRTLLPRISDQLVAAPTAPEIPNSWRVVQLAGLALALFFCWSLWQSSVFSRLQSSARFAPAVRDRRLTLILIAGFTVYFILMILMWPALHGAKHSGVGLESCLLFAAFIVVLTTLMEGIWRARAGAPKCALVTEEGQPRPKESKSTPQVRGGEQGAGSTVGAMQATAPRRYESPDEDDKNMASTARKTWEERAAVLKSNLDARALRWKPWIGLGLFVVATGILLFGVGIGEHEEETSALVRFYSTLRAIQLTSGLSFLMPTFFFLTVWLWWAEQVSSGYALLDDRRPRLPRNMSNERFRHDQLPDLCAVITPGPLRFLRYGVVPIVLAAAGVVLMGMHHPIMTLERPLLEWAMTILFLLAICGIVVSTLQTWSVWLGLRKLLVRLDASPLRAGFKTLEGFSWRPIWRFGAGSLDEYLRVFSRHREALDSALNTVPQLASVRPRLETALGRVMTLVDGARKKSLLWHFFARRKQEEELMREFGEYQEIAADAAGCALEILADDWKSKKEETKPSRLEAMVPWATRDDIKAVSAKLETEEDDRQLRACERLVCMSYTSFIMVMLVRIRTLIVAIGGMYVLTLIAISQYPFEPKGALQLLLVGLLVFVIAIVGLVFAQIHRDTVLSNLTDTKPGELGLDFFIRMAAFIALPLFSLLASQFPSINRFVYSWLQPAVEAINR